MARREPLARSALWLPLFDELSDPTVCARLASEAEEAGWHGFFVWDQLRWEAPVRQVSDSWITLAAIATATGDAPEEALGTSSKCRVGRAPQRETVSENVTPIALSSTNTNSGAAWKCRSATATTYESRPRRVRSSDRPGLATARR